MVLTDLAPSSLVQDPVDIPRTDFQPLLLFPSAGSSGATFVMNAEIRKGEGLMEVEVSLCRRGRLVLGASIIGSPFVSQLYEKSPVFAHLIEENAQRFARALRSAREL